MEGTDEEFNNYFRKMDRFVTDKTKEKQDMCEMKGSQSHNSLSEKSVKSEKFSSDVVQTDSEESEEVESRRQLVLQNYKQSCLEKYNREYSNKNLTSVENNLLSKLLDITSKEQERLDEEKKILSIALMAQADRWRREATEDGIRQRQMLRGNIKRQIQEEAYDRICEDIVNEFDYVLRDSLLSTAVIEVEDDIRTTIFNIDRENIPKLDDSFNQENMIVDFKKHLNEQLEFEPNMLECKTQVSMRDLGEITDKVEDLYEDIITMALDLDNLVSTIINSDVNESKLLLLEDKIHDLLTCKNIQPVLERLQNETKNRLTNVELKQEVYNDMESMEKLCDNVIDIADDLYDTVIGDSEITDVLNQIDEYYDDIVKDKFISYIDKHTSLYIFKLMKISHILTDKNKAEFLNGSAYKVLQSAKQFCYTVTDIAGKIVSFITSNEFKEIEVDSVLEAELSTGSNMVEWYKTGLERLCEKFKIKFDKKHKTKVESIDRIKEKIKEAKSLSKIDVCKVREEAAEIIESVVSIWLTLDSMVNQMETETSNTDIKQEILTKLKCVINKLQDQFGNIEIFGMKELCCSLESAECTKETMLFRSEREAKNIVDTLIINAAQLRDMKQEGTIDLNKEITFLEEPLKTDLALMINEPKKYPAVQKLTDSSFESF